MTIQAPSRRHPALRPGTFVQLAGTLLFCGLVPGISLADSAAVLVKDIRQAAPFAQETESLYRVGDKVFFFAADAVHGQELWVTDGSAEGTHMVKDLSAGNTESSTGVTMLGQTKGLLIFNLNAGGVWRSDGTAEGTFMISRAKVLRSQLALGTFWFEAEADLAQGITGGPWRSDGTEEGTYPLLAPVQVGSAIAPSTVIINPPTGPEVPQGSRFVAIGDSIYFRTENYHILGFNETTGITTDFGIHLPTWDLRAGGSWASATTGFSTHRMAWHAFRGDGQGFVDLAPDQEWSSVRCAGALGDIHFVVVRAVSDNRWSLWRSDGTPAGTWMVKPLPDSQASPVPFGFTSAKGKIFFVTDDERKGSEPWVTDGTAEGTMLLKEVRKGKFGSQVKGFHVSGDSVYFGGSDGYRLSLWKSDGTPKGTVRFLTSPKDVLLKGLLDQGALPVVMDDVLYFSAARHKSGSQRGPLGLWRSDGTNAGTYPLTGGDSGNSRPPDSDIANGIQAVGDSVIFRAWDSEAGVLWKSDGTEAGTYPLEADPKKPTADWGARNLCNLGDQILFVNMESSGKKRRTLFTSDGGQLSATLIPGIPAKGYPTGITNMIRAGEWAYLHTERHVWATGGDKQSTFKLVDIAKLDGKIEADTMRTLGGDLVFSTGSLWKASADTKTVEMLVDSSALSFIPINLTVVDETLYFSGWKQGSFQLWKSDGTAQGTAMVTDQIGIAGELSNFTAAGGYLWFTFKPSNSVLQLWRSDGTGAGTSMVATVPVEFGMPSEGPGGRLLFRAWTPPTGVELWISDGTAEGTGLVKDIDEGGGSSMISKATRVGDHAYFAATHPVHGRELWKTDGTPEGTILVSDLTGDAGSSSPHHLVVAGSKLFFDATTAEAGREVHVIDVLEDLAEQ